MPLLFNESKTEKFGNHCSNVSRSVLVLYTNISIYVFENKFEYKVKNNRQE